MNDANPQACSLRTGRSNGFLPSSFRAIFRSASTLASTVRSAGSSVASTITVADEDCQHEQVQWAGFDKIELAADNGRQVLLLTYTNGFQVWDVENADEVQEIVSKRDGPVIFLRVQPQPTETSDEKSKLAHPLVLVVTFDAPNCRNNGSCTNGYSAVVASPVAENLNAPTLVKFYSLQSHSYVHTLRFCTAILAVRCSPRVVAVALATKLYCFNAATLQSTFSVLTYPSPQLGSSRLSFGHGALAVGPRWLAYAANQPVISNTGRVSPQHLTPSPGVSPSTSPANGSLVAHYAKESSKQLAAGIATLGDKGYRALSRYCTEVIGSPVSGSPFLNGSCGHTEHAGTVIVRDYVTKLVVSQFRAHDSPLSALSFDGTGTLLVTASIHGHNINIFRILPAPYVNGINTGSYDPKSSHAHLYKLYRGMTNAVIQDIAFSEDSHWIVVSSSRGTHHLFAISPFGGAVGPSTHGAGLVDCALGSVQSLPWWSNRGPLRSSQCVSGNSPATVSLSVVSRIKIGNGGWCGTMSGAAAAANGRSCSSLGAVAVLFHDGRGCKVDAEGSQNTLKEQLWVLAPSGNLIQHALHLSAGTEGHFDRISSPIVAGIQKEELDFKVTVEPLQKWDLCRRPNWVEREEKVNISNALNVAHDLAGNSIHSTRIKAGLSQNEATVDTILKETRNKQIQQGFLSNAEVHMHHLRPPIWESSQISFHVLSGSAFNNKVLLEEDSGGEFEIEKVISRVVEVRKKDLVPVLDMFRNYQVGEDVRDANYLPKGRLNPLNLQSNMKFGFNTHVGVSQSQYSSSGSSCGSEGSLCGGVNVGSNDGHHPNEDRSLELQFQPMNPFLVHEPHRHFHAERSKLQNAQSPSIYLFKSQKGITPAPVGFPSMNISFQNRDTHAMDSKTRVKLGVNCLDMLQGARVSVLLHDKDVVTAGDDVTFEKQLINAGRIPNGCHSNDKDLKCMGSAETRSDSKWMASAIEEAGHSLRTQTVDSDKTSESLPTFIDKNLEKLDLQHYEAVTDVESTDGNSKSEDFGGEQGQDGFEGEHGEDGWEGALFPFVEDC